MQIKALFEKIRWLTAESGRLVEKKDIETGLPLLKERQLLLEHLHNKLETEELLQDESEIKPLYIALLTEIQTLDQRSLATVVNERNNTKKSIQQQSITNKAISVYQKTLSG